MCKFIYANALFKAILIVAALVMVITKFQSLVEPDLN